MKYKLYVLNVMEGKGGGCGECLVQAVSLTSNQRAPFGGKQFFGFECVSKPLPTLSGQGR